jgi:hypothetical protein
VIVAREDSGIRNGEKNVGVTRHVACAIACEVPITKFPAHVLEGHRQSSCSEILLVTAYRLFLPEGEWMGIPPLGGPRDHYGPDRQS